MLKIRVREYTPAGVKGRVLPASEISVTDVENGTATLSFQLSTRVAGKMETPFVAGVEYAVGSGKFQSLTRNNLFILDEDSGDDADQTKTVTFKGESYIPWLMGRNFIWWYGNVNGNERTFGKGTPVSAGQMLRWDLVTNRSSGWAPNLALDFSDTHDSNGQAWQAADKVQDLKIRLPMVTLKFVEQLSSQGLCEWSTSGMTFRLFRPGTTRDKTNVVLGGPRCERVPVKSDASELFTTLTVMPSSGSRQVISVPNADMRFGKLDAMVTMSGVSDAATATRMAQPYLATAQKPKREESYEWNPESADIVPWRDFQIGDTVIARARGGRVQRRVIGVVVRQSGNETTVRTVVGERVGSSALRQAQRLASVSVGGVAGGTGAAFPASVGPDRIAPANPNGLNVTANVGEWLDDGKARATVTLSWAAVTENVDGTEADVDQYEVWSRLPSEPLTRDTATAATTATVESWAPGVQRLVAVRVRSKEGVWSAFSNELSVTPVQPASIVPAKPQAPTVTSNTAAFTSAGAVASIVLDWPDVTTSTEGVAITVESYEVWNGTAPVANVSASTATVTVPSGQSAEFRVRAHSSRGLVGDVSDQVSVTGATPGTPSLIPTQPTLTSGSAVVVARWDGNYSGGSAPGAHIVWVDARVQGEASWVRQGVSLSGAGSQLVRIGSVGDIVEVRFVAVDQLGREAGISSVSTVVVSGISGDDIVAGSITGNRLAVGTIEADYLAPNVGSTLNLTANDAIVLMAARQDATETIATTAQQNAATALSEALAAEEAAGTAQATADTAAGAALVAQSTASDVNNRLTAHQAVFKVTATGAVVATPNSAQELILNPGFAALAQNGVEISRWEAARMIVNEAVLNRAQIGSHTFENYASGRTIIRPL